MAFELIRPHLVWFTAEHRDGTYDLHRQLSTARLKLGNRIPKR